MDPGCVKTMSAVRPSAHVRKYIQQYLPLANGSICTVLLTVKHHLGTDFLVFVFWAFDHIDARRAGSTPVELGNQERLKGLYLSQSLLAGAYRGVSSRGPTSAYHLLALSFVP